MFLWPQNVLFVWYYLGNVGNGVTCFGCGGGGAVFGWGGFFDDVGFRLGVLGAEATWLIWFTIYVSGVGVFDGMFEMVFGGGGGRVRFARGAGAGGSSFCYGGQSLGSFPLVTLSARPPVRLSACCLSHPPLFGVLPSPPSAAIRRPRRPPPVSAVRPPHVRWPPVSAVHRSVVPDFRHLSEGGVNVVVLRVREGGGRGRNTIMETRLPVKGARPPSEILTYFFHFSPISPQSS